MKTNEGFYKYPNPKVYQDPDFLKIIINRTMIENTKITKYCNNLLVYYRNCYSDASTEK